MVSHKLPMFAIQFLNTGEVWLMCKPEDICNVSEYIKTGNVSNDIDLGIDLSDIKDCISKPKRMIGSSESSRNSFNEEKRKKYDKTRSAK